MDSNYLVDHKLGNLIHKTLCIYSLAEVEQRQLSPSERSEIGSLRAIYCFLGKHVKFDKRKGYEEYFTYLERLLNEGDFDWEDGEKFLSWCERFSQLKEFLE